MAGTEDTEITAVEGGDLGDAQALGDRHETAVYDIEFCAGIGGGGVVDRSKSLLSKGTSSVSLSLKLSRSLRSATYPRSRTNR